MALASDKREYSVDRYEFVNHCPRFQSKSGNEEMDKIEACIVSSNGDTYSQHRYQKRRLYSNVSLPLLPAVEANDVHVPRLPRFAFNPIFDDNIDGFNCLKDFEKV